jgi:YD repeat-containing protein
VKSTRLALLLLLPFVLPAGLVAQAVSPNLERGVSAGKAFHSGDVDDVNLFNGNLNITLPIGQPYHVNGNLSYQFALHFAGNSWETGSRRYQLVEPDGSVVDLSYGWMFPSRRTNAGLGWILSLGSVFMNNMGDQKIYESPDGSQHTFYEKPHPNASNVVEPVGTGMMYTRDSTYLRLSFQPGIQKVEFPNGEIHTFGDPSGRLQRMEDRFGNFVNITYDDGTSNAYGGKTWQLTDSLGRSQYVYFKPGALYNETNSATNYMVSHDVVKEIALTGFGDCPASGTCAQTSARYVFHYENEGDPTTAWSRLYRPWSPDPDPLLGLQTSASLLTSITLPDQSTFSFDYDRGTAAGSNGSGALTRLTLPTGGRMMYTYQDYAFPEASGTGPANGVATRTTYDAANTPLGLTVYETHLNQATFPAKEKTTTVTVLSGDGSTTLAKSKHFFSVCPQIPLPRRGGAFLPCGNALSGEYGLPLTRVTQDDVTGATRTNPDSGGRYLSSQTLQRNGAGAWVPARSTYLAYEADGTLVDIYTDDLDKNRRVVSQSTLYDDGKSAATASSDFDGYGHYRQTDTSGTFGRGDVRSALTRFNPARGAFTLDTTGHLTNPTMAWPAGDPWILGTFDYQTVSEQVPDEASATQGVMKNVTATSLACFDTKGSLTRSRSLKNNTAGHSFTDLPFDGHDTLTALFRNLEGNVTSERYYGGDTGSSLTGTDCNSSLPTSPAYQIDHTYTMGSLKTSQYAGASFKLADNEIDPATGLVSGSYAGSTGTATGLHTKFLYDMMGRLTDVQPDLGTNRGAWTKYLFSVNPPKVDVYQLPNGSGSTGSALAHSTAEFDVLGRVWRESFQITDGSTVTRETVYDGAGRKASVSEWGSPAPSSHLTLFKYDDLGRATEIEAPDHKKVSMGYTGVAQVRRTVQIRTAGDGNSETITPATTTENYDRQGRLWRVTEPSNVDTEYGYDIGGRLSTVCQGAAGTTCGQRRLFSYDNRGFMNWEQHPEKGKTTYLDYDAKGHATRRYDGSAQGPFDLTFTYDPAERLTTVAETRLTASVHRLLKSFDFGTDNATGDFRNGKLTRATRFNWFDFYGLNVQVVETYVYGGKDGRVSARNTAEFECALCNAVVTGAPKRLFEQAFTYDDLGNPLTVNHSTCSGLGCNSPTTTTVTNEYAKGYLKSVSFPFRTVPQVSSLSYASNGTLSQVLHGNGVADQIGRDLNDMQRPASLTTLNASDVSACTPASITVQPASSTITFSQPVSLSVVATGDNDSASHPLTYEWFQGASGVTSTPLSGCSGSSCPQTVGATTSFWVRVTNNCGPSANSIAATITMCTPPVINSPLVDDSISANHSSLLLILDSNATSHQWYQGPLNGGTALLNETSDRLLVSPAVTTSYWVKVSNDCGSANSGATITVFAPPTTPSNTTAAYVLLTNQSYGVQVGWSPATAAAGLDHYEVERSFDGGAYAVVASPSASTTNWVDGSLSPDKTYVYRVRAVDSKLAVSNWGPADIATTKVFTDDPLLAGTTPFKGIHVGELRQAIDAVRRSASLPPQWSSYAAPTTLISGADYDEMRTALNVARAALSVPVLTFTRPSLAGQLLSVVDTRELRDGVK